MDIENDINELVQKWLESGWIDATQPELFVMGTGIKRLLEANPPNDSTPFKELIGVYMEEIDALQIDMRMEKAYYDNGYKKYIQGKITELSRVVTDLRRLVEV